MINGRFWPKAVWADTLLTAKKRSFAMCLEYVGQFIMVLFVIIEHGAHQTLALDVSKYSEKARLTQPELVALAIMGRAGPPVCSEHPELGR